MRKLCFFLFALPSLFAFETAPYMPPLFECQFHFGYSYQHYHHVGSFVDRTSNNYFDADLSIAITPVLEVGLESSWLKTSGEGIFFNHFGGILRYLLLDDIIGDPLSWTVQLQIKAPTRKALASTGRFHQGRFEALLSTVLGKEFSSYSFFTYRMWVLLGLGLTDRGSWFTSNRLHWEMNSQDVWRFNLFATFDGGLGHRKLLPPGIFSGYQKVAYRSLNLGASIIVYLGLWGDLTFAYDRGVWARKAPKRANRYMVTYHLPFSIF